MPDTRETVNHHEIALLSSLVCSTESDLEYIQKETAEFLGYLSITELRVASERVVDLYFKADNARYGCSYGFTNRCVDPFVRALLETLVDQDDAVQSERIAYRTIRGIAVAIGFSDTHLSSVGMAASCNFARHLGQPRT